MPSRHPPFGLAWRSSYWFTAFVVGLGISTDLLVYSCIIPVMPFQLQELGYTDVSSLVGWLLFAYSAGLVLSTIPTAMFSERYNARRTPLIIGLMILAGSQVMLMEAPVYSVMCIARILQGAGSSMVWVIGLALICDVTPERFIGRQLGIAMAGLSIGTLIGPSVGGALYSRFGFRGPFIFSLAVTLLDFVGRIAIVERNDAILWGADPAAHFASNISAAETGNTANDSIVSTLTDKAETNVFSPPVHPPPVDAAVYAGATISRAKAKPTSLLTVIRELAKSSRALVAIITTLIFGVVYTSQEPSIPLHLHTTWGLDSGKVGLVFLAAVIPTLLSSALSGMLVDRLGPEWITFGSLVLALPWWVMLIITRPLALFIVSLAVEAFFTVAVISPLTAELAVVSRGIKGVGYAHIYGAFNIAYGAGAALGPVIGGQIYDHAKHGWTMLCLLSTGLIVVALVLTFSYTGNDPLFRRLSRALQTAPPS